MGYSRDSFYRFKELYDKGGELALQEISRRKPVLKNRVAAGDGGGGCEPSRSTSQPGGRCASPTSCGSADIRFAGRRALVWLRHDLETMKKRLKALEAKSRPGRPDPDREPIHRAGKGQGRQGSAWRVRERMPGLLRGAGHLLRRHVKGVGRIYQQTFLDTYAKVAFAKLYDRKTPLAAADLLNDRVVPSSTPTESGSAAC